MKVKYATVLIDSIFPIPQFSEVKFENATFTRKSLKSQIEKAEASHWEKWLGSIFWEQLNKENYMITSYMETKTPEVLDGENSELTNKVFDIKRLLPLVEILYPPGDMTTITGLGNIEGNELQLIDVRQVSRSGKNYFIESGFLRHHPDFSKHPMTWQPNGNFFKHWINLHSHFLLHFRKDRQYEQLLEAYRSFEESFKSSYLEFKIPNLVRSIECILGLRSGEGATVFAERTQFFIGSPDLPFTTKKTVKELLIDLYQLRNDCVHGKKFASTLKANLGSEFKNELVFEYEYLAEFVARLILTTAFVNDKMWPHLKDRKTIEEAWAQKKISL